MTSAFVIAAPSSGSGKTSVSLGILKALKNQSLNVQSFKCGPDYIDTLLHSSIIKKPGINLDMFFSSSQQISGLFSKYASQADISVVEGVMGLFDGFHKSEGSTASIAKALGLPVVLVVDAKATAYSVAPLLYGFKHFDPEVKLAGVIFNRVGSEGHYQYLKDAANETGVTALGYLPASKNFHLPERYLGLNFDHSEHIQHCINLIAEQVTKTVDLDKLLKVSSVQIEKPALKAKTKADKKIKIAVSRDEAFTFTYHENIQRLSEIGEINYFSPLHDKELPQADFVYLSGGYPEKHLKQLSGNHSMLKAIREYVKAGKYMLAECGGMMYLGKQIIDDQGRAYDMAGVFEFSTSMEHRKIHMGYRKLYLNNSIIKGHEFHYSEIINDESEQKTGKITNSKDADVKTFFYRKNNCFASYMHLYSGEESIIQTLSNPNYAIK